MKFFEVIISIILFFYLFKILIRLIAPFILKRIMKRMQERFYNQYQEDTMGEEGEVTIESQSKNNNSKNDIDAEYVDFEEIED
tara:strand:+ start:201 stop:449 length:249 start_codon:yes stop_codon:yes gene_type:complete